MILTIINCFCGMVSNRGYCQRSSPSRISNTPRARFEPVENLISGFIELNCALVITSPPRRHTWFLNGMLHWAEMGLKKIFITADFKLESAKMFTEVLLTGLRIQAKVPSHSRDCVLGEGQLYALPLMANGQGIFSIL